MSDHIHTVNALKIRNQFGEVLEMLESNGQPILVSKGRKVRAVLITPEDFKTRFVDRLADDARQRRLEELQAVREPMESGDALDRALRELRGELR
jgi:PHD/YefM family antitoxin component YafN of YafNO toxin-antitoxin module